VDFKNTIICLTSNLGSDILQNPEFTGADGVVTTEGRELVMARATSFFPPELINRLDSIQTFNRLSHKSILAIVSLRLGDVTERLKDRRITLDVDQTTREWLAKHGYSNEYGARAIARIVRNTVLSPLAKKLLAGTIRDGDVVSVRVSEDSTTLDVKDNHLSENAETLPTPGRHPITPAEDVHY